MLHLASPSTSHLLLCAVLACISIGASAAEPSSFNLPEYKLSMGESDASLPNAKSPEATAPEPARLFSVSERLAARPYAKLIESAAREAAIDPALVHAVISVESAYNSVARSPKGAIGLMQLMPGTAMRYGVNDPSRSPEVNLRAGTLYLRDLMKMFNGRIDLVLAAYNAGENAVIRYGQKIPPYAETQAYVPAVLAKYREWRVPLPPAPDESKDPSANAPVRIQYMVGTQLDVSVLRAEGYR